MAYSLSPWLKPRFFITGTNRPLAGGLMYTYKAGTTDPATTYSDDAGTTNTNPIELNSDGECDLYLDDSVSYRIILKNSAGVTQFDRDRIASIGSTQVQSFNSIAALRLRSGTTAANAAKTLGYYSAGDGGGNAFYWNSVSTATDNGGTVIKPTAVSGAGRWLAVDTSYINVKQFGAVGDGVADDTAEIQAALDYVSSVGGELNFPPSTYLTSAKLTISGSAVSLRGSNRGASIIQSSASVGIGTNDTTVRRHCKISGLKVKKTSANSIGIDFTYFSYSDFSFNTIELAGNNSTAFYGVGNEGGSSPYYNTFYQNYLAKVSPATTGCIGYKLDQYVSGSTRRGPNSNVFIGGRVSTMLKSVDIQAGNNNTFIGIASESVISGGYHIWLGSDTPHYTGTATAGATGSITDAGATFASLSNGAVKITGGTGAGQANRTDNNSGTVINAARNWPIKPDATSVYEAYGATVVGNTFVNFRFEGSSGSNGIGESPSAYGNEFFGTYVTSLGAGKTFDAAVFPDADFLGFNAYKAIQSFTFTLDDIAAGLTNQALRAGGGSSTQILTPFDGDIVGIAVNSSATRSGGTLTVNPTVSGVVISAVSAVLNADVTNNNVQMYPVRSVLIGGKNRRIGAVVTTDGSWNPVTADISVTVFVLPRG